MASQSHYETARFAHSSISQLDPCLDLGMEALITLTFSDGRASDILILNEDESDDITVSDQITFVLEDVQIR